MNDCEEVGLSLSTVSTSSETRNAKVYLHNLFRALHKFCPTEPGRLNLVWIILHGLFRSDTTAQADCSLGSILPLARRWLEITEPERQQTYRTLGIIARDFLDGFFIPLTAQSSCTPSVPALLTPASSSNVGPSQGTPMRLGGLCSL